tara:strand:- start:2752 stop:3933 length:1182 start_codon:yes stop_codon:yes gene_type:complete
MKIGKLRKKTRLFLLVLLFLLIDFSASKLYEHVYDYPFHERYKALQEKESELEKQFRTKHPHYHHDLKKNIDGLGVMTLGNEHKISTNSLGFKDLSNQTVPLQSSKRRILVIGDSFTEGVGNPYRNTFCGLLAEHYAKQNIEVHNAGVASYTACLYWLKLKYLIEKTKFEFDEVILLPDISDLSNEISMRKELDQFKVPVERNNTQTSDFVLDQLNQSIDQTAPTSIQGEVKFFLKQHTVLTYLILNTIKDTLVADPHDRSYGILMGVNEKHPWELDDYLSQTDSSLIFDSMDHLHELLSSREIKLTIIIYPWPQQIFQGEDNTQYAKEWKEWCSRKKVNLIDLFGNFIQTAKKQGSKEFIEENFHRRDNHWNQKGHAFVAEQILQEYKPQTN